MNPLISVIVPAYNAECYVDRCLSALLAQTYQNLEIVIVDDGSKDATYTLCREWEEKSDKVRAYTQDNKGASAARNVGLERCSGEFIAFADVDDIVFPDYIAYLYQLIKEHDADVSMCAAYKMSTVEKLPQYFKEGPVQVLEQTEALKSLFYRKGITGYPVLKLWKRDIAQEGRFREDMRYGEDFTYVYEMLKRCSKVVYGEKVQYIYYQNPNSVNRSTDYKQLVHCWDVFSSQIVQDVRKNYPALDKAVIAKNYIFAVDFYNRINRKKDDWGLRKRLKCYIKRYGIAVYKDRDCKKLNRVLGIMGGISPVFLCFACRRFYDLKRIFRFEVRKSV